MPACCLILAFLLAADGPEKPAEDDIPVVGRPADLPFSGASGKFTVSASASPTTLSAGQPLTFTLTVRAASADGKELPVYHPPGRIDLEELPEFKERFHITAPPDPADSKGDGRVWEFRYILKPKSPSVDEIPGVPFVYFDPSIGPAGKRFQVPYTDPIPLRVGQAESVVQSLKAPEAFFQIATGPELLETRAPGKWPAPALALLLGPPLLCGLAYAVWRRLNPDAARLARTRRSKAARLALGALASLRRVPEPERAGKVAEIVARYLRQKYDLPGGELTPARAEQWLRERELPPDLGEKVAALLRDCDEARFGFPQAGGKDLAGEAEQTIREVEAMP